VFNPPVGPHVMLGYSNNTKANLETFDKVSKELANFLPSKCFSELSKIGFSQRIFKDLRKKGKISSS
jgi:hypothetical protein